MSVRVILVATGIHFMCLEQYLSYFLRRGPFGSIGYSGGEWRCSQIWGANGCDAQPKKFFCLWWRREEGRKRYMFGAVDVRGAPGVTAACVGGLWLEWYRLSRCVVAWGVDGWITAMGGELLRNRAWWEVSEECIMKGVVEGGVVVWEAHSGVQCRV